MSACQVTTLVMEIFILAFRVLFREMKCDPSKWAARAKLIGEGDQQAKSHRT